MVFVRSMPAPTHDLPPYDLHFIRAQPFPERLRLICRTWAYQVNATPPAVYLMYVGKIALLFVGGWWFFCWWGGAAAGFTPIAFMKAVLWSMTYEVLGLKYRLFHAFSAGYGYDGIVVAFLEGGHPLLAILGALFLGGLRSGANIMQRAVGVPTTVVDTIQGLVVIFVAASLAFRFEQSRWAAIWRRRKAMDAALGETA